MIRSSGVNRSLYCKVRLPIKYPETGPVEKPLWLRVFGYIATGVQTISVIRGTYSVYNYLKVSYQFGELNDHT